MKNSTNKLFNISLIFAVGLLLLYLAPLYILQENAHLRIHDNLDSNVVWAKLLSDTGTIFAPLNSEIPNVINGLPRIAMSSEWNVYVWLFALFPPIVGYTINLTIMRAIAFIGMLLLLKNHFLKNQEAQWMLVGVSLCYAIIPFWPPGGLSIAGLPLALYSFLNIRNKDGSLKDWLVIVILPFYSSLVLSFFFFLFFMAILWLYDGLTKKGWNIAFFLAMAVMSAMYLFVEYRLVSSVIFGLPFLPHRLEFSIGHLSFRAVIILAIKNFIIGHTHVLTEHQFVVLPVTFFTLLYTWITRKDYKLLTFLVFFNGMLSLLYSGWSWHRMRYLKDNIDFFNAFNMSRFHFLQPPLWYIIFAVCLFIIMKHGKLGQALIMVLLVAQIGVLFLFNDEIKYRHYGTPTFKEFYAENLFKDVQAYIGEDPSNYRVVSLGIHPTIAQYNGFYTLDTYNNIYPLSYKHQFREVIAPELKQNRRIRRYFDVWGGRCYLFSHELGKHYLFTKEKEKVIKDLSINTQTLKDLGGNYILSAVRIQNAKAEDLKLLKTFDDSDAAWRIFLYKIQ